MNTILFLIFVKPFFQTEFNFPTLTTESNKLFAIFENGIIIKKELLYFRLIVDFYLVSIAKVGVGVDVEHKVQVFLIRFFCSAETNKESFIVSSGKKKFYLEGNIFNSVKYILGECEDRKTGKREAANTGSLRALVLGLFLRTLVYAKEHFNKEFLTFEERAEDETDAAIKQLWSAEVLDHELVIYDKDNRSFVEGTSYIAKLLWRKKPKNRKDGGKQEKSTAETTRTVSGSPVTKTKNTKRRFVTLWVVSGMALLLCGLTVFFYYTEKNN